ncbi:MAG: DUF1501 domain-containing protein, partial [Myxococcota bacterium]|nr:DUF1501 domain-containing protein [Myxococcota bacterium]
METRTGKLSRRDLLRGALAVAGGAAALNLFPGAQRLAYASAMTARHYVFCYFSGGWDILLGLDPRDPRLFNQSTLRSTLIQPAYELLDGPSQDIIRAPNGMTFGPHIGELIRHADRLAVVRGISMETLTHEVGRRRFITGKAPSGLLARGSSASTWLAAKLGAEEAIPNLSLRVENFNQGLPSYASALRAGGVEDLLRVLSPTDEGLPLLAQRQVDESLASAENCEGVGNSPLLRAAAASRQKLQEMIRGNYSQLFEFNRPEFESLRDHYGFTRVSNDPEVQAALAAQALTSGLSRCVNIQVANGLDTHFDNWSSDQGARQERGFNAIARLADDLASREYPTGDGSSWLDHTTIVGFSEFSRTPLINDRGGRDHALTNAALLLGGSVRGGQVIGASSDVGMQPTTLNPVTGELDPGGEVIRPEHILQT